MQAERGAAPFQLGADRLGAVLAFEKQVRIRVKAELEETHLIPKRPIDRLLRRQPAAHIDADPVPDICHCARALVRVREDKCMMAGVSIATAAAASNAAEI